MPTFRTKLVNGGRKPYDTWVFVVVPPDVRRALGGGARIAVRGTVNGEEFRSTIARGEGVHRFPLTHEVRAAAGVGAGDEVKVVVEADAASRDVEVPAELRAVLVGERLEAAYAAMAPSHRRAWALHVGEAKRPETRAKRAADAARGIRARLFPGQ